VRYSANSALACSSCLMLFPLVTRTALGIEDLPASSGDFVVDRAQSDLADRADTFVGIPR
jgi:hypothetical protein